MEYLAIFLGNEHFFKPWLLSVAEVCKKKGGAKGRGEWAEGGDRNKDSLKKPLLGV